MDHSMHGHFTGKLGRRICIISMHVRACTLLWTIFHGVTFNAKMFQIFSLDQKLVFCMSSMKLVQNCTKLLNNLVDEYMIMDQIERKKKVFGSNSRKEIPLCGSCLSRVATNPFDFICLLSPSW